MTREEESLGQKEDLGWLLNFFRCVCKPASCTLLEGTVGMSSKEREIRPLSGIRKS
jgi:hypothetical protein